MLSINYHRRTGLSPGWSLTIDRYGIGVVYGVRMGWALLTFSRMYKK